MRGLVERVSGELGKSVRLVESRFDARAIPSRMTALVREALAQLTRNSLAHGLESPEERKEAGKLETGTIEVRSALEDGKLTITYRDDGRGLQLDKIKERALAEGAATAENIAAMSPGQLANLIFEPGFSTAEQEDLNAGLDLVRSSLKQFQGGITATSSPGKFCEFRITVPARNEHD